MSVAAAHASAFYSEVARSGIVWAIRDQQGYPAPAGSGGARAMPFWSLQSRADKVIESVPDYAGFVPVSILWQEFCDHWIPGLVADGLLVGLNWSGVRATGYDVPPADVGRGVDLFREGGDGQESF